MFTYRTVRVLTVHSGDSFSASNSVGSSLSVQGFSIRDSLGRVRLQMGLSHSIVDELSHFKNVLLPFFTVGFPRTAFTIVCLHSYASTEDKLLIALSLFELLGMYPVEVR